MAVSRRNGVISFGVFEVNAAAYELRKHGLRVRLPRQPLAILLSLLERPGDIVSRDELRRRLWPDDTFVDFEHGLNSAVKKLRAALGDSADRPQYIETLPRIGYRFIAPISPIDWSPEPAPAHQSGSGMISVPTQVGASRRGRPLAWLVAATATVIIAGIAAMVWPTPSVRMVGAARLTNDSRSDRWGRIQTDGVRLFFLQRRGHRWDLVQMPASGGAVEAFGTPFTNAKILAISPDSSELLIGSFETRNGLLPLWLIPSVGGTPVRLADVRATDAVFTPDGSRITFSTDDGVYLVRRDGTDRRRLFELDGDKESLGWSPDGRALRFEWADHRRGTREIWEANATGQDLHPVLPGWDKEPSQCCGRWTADGRYYIFVSHNHGGAQNIWAIPEHRWLSLISRRDPILVSTGPVVMDQPLPAAGDRLFALGSNEQAEYVLFDPATRQYESLLGGVSALLLTFSPDGQSVLYVRNATLWRSRPDGSDRIEIAASSFHPARSFFSPDGREIAFEGTEDNHTSNIYVVAAEGGTAREVVAGVQTDSLAGWSPDARVMYSMSDGPSASLCMFDPRTRVTTTLPPSAGYDASWSPDGRLLGAETADGSRVLIFDAAANQWTPLVGGRVLGPVVWSSDSRYVYYQDVLEENEPVRRIDVSSRSVEVVADFHRLLEGDVQRCGFERMTSDGRLLLRLMRGDHDVYSLNMEFK